VPIKQSDFDALYKQLTNLIPAILDLVKQVGKYIPTRQQLEAIRPDDLLPNCFGKMVKVVEVTHRANDINGKYFICVKLEFGENSTITDAYKEMELHRDTALSAKHTSWELDVIERKLVGKMSQP